MIKQCPFYLFLFLFFIFLTTPSWAQTLHLIVVTDHIHSSYQRSAVKDGERIVRELKQIAKETNLRFVAHRFHRNKEQAIVKHIHQLNTGHDDVVCFFYVGHARNDGTTRWPTFAGNHFDLVQVHQKLIAKQARLIITLYDGCNWTSPNQTTFSRSSTAISSLASSFYTPFLQQHYQLLFRASRGHIKLATAAPGHYASGNSEIGNVGIHSFFFALKNVDITTAKQQTQIWQQVGALMREEANHICTSSGRVAQNPIYDGYIQTTALTQPIYIFKPHYTEAHYENFGQRTQKAVDRFIQKWLPSMSNIKNKAIE